MSRTSKHSAPASAGPAVSIYEFKDGAQFIHLQNNSAENIRVGYAAADLLTNGIRVPAGELYIVPLSGAGEIFVISEGGAVTDEIILSRG